MGAKVYLREASRSARGSLLRRSGDLQEEHGASITSEVSNVLVAPRDLSVQVVLKSRALDAVDEHAPESHLADDFVKRTLADEHLLERVAESVAGSTNEHEDVAENAPLGGVVLLGDEVTGDQLVPGWRSSVDSQKWHREA